MERIPFQQALQEYVKALLPSASSASLATLQANIVLTGNVSVHSPEGYTVAEVLSFLMESNSPFTLNYNPGEGFYVSKDLLLPEFLVKDILKQEEKNQQGDNTWIYHPGVFALISSQYPRLTEDYKHVFAGLAQKEGDYHGFDKEDT